MNGQFDMTNKKCKCTKKRIIVCGAVIILLIACVVGYVYIGRGEDVESNTPPVQTAVTVNDQTIETTFASVQIPADCLGKIQHMEIVEGDVTMEVFSMLPEAGGRELFRICFGSTETGNPIGMWVVNDEEIPISVATPEHDTNAFSAEEKEVYFGVMDHLNAILSSILEHENFKKIEQPQQVELVEATHTAGLAYWEIELPEDVEWKESKTDDVYKVDFYGILGGERIRLYTVSLGEVSAESALGAFEADGMTRTLGVKTHSLSSQVVWMDEERMAAYNAMMDTVNDVLQVIMASENYIE